MRRAALLLACVLLCSPWHAHGFTDPLWNHTLLPHMLKKSIAYEGSGEALMRFVEKLKRGERVVVTAIGGSVTHGHGGPPGASEPALGFPGSWSRLVFDFIAARWRHKEHLYVNGAVPATGANYFARCLRRHLHAESDLVLLEFGVNDGELIHLEAIVRRIKAQFGGVGSGPAIMFVSFWANWPGRNDSLAMHPWRSLLADGNSETYATLVAQWYDVIALSARNAWVFEDLHNTSGFSYEDYDFGGNHPNARGHRLLADMTIHMLQRGAHELARHEELTLPPAYLDWLPPPLVDNNTAEASEEVCHFGSDLSLLVSSDAGWTADNSSKPGLWGNATSAALDLSVPLRPGTDKLVLFFLRSWQPAMGAARVECLAGCACEPQEVDAHGGDASVMVSHAFALTGVSREAATDGAPVSVACALRVTSLRGTFKLMGITTEQTLAFLVRRPPGYIRAEWQQPEAANASVALNATSA